MASTNPTHEFAPIRTENILSDETSHLYPEHEIERPQPIASDSSDSIVEDEEKLSRTQTSRSARERRGEFQPIFSGDREQLQRLASQYGGSVALSRTNTHPPSDLERKDTLAGVKIGDSILDPNSPEFDLYKWLRMCGTCLETEHIAD